MAYIICESEEHLLIEVNRWPKVKRHAEEVLPVDRTYNVPAIHVSLFSA
jgi:hypothetical protein